MRKVTFGVANSLDNYIAREDGSVDWLLWSDDLTKIMREFWRSIDVILMGRKTYEISQRLGGAPPMTGVVTYVFSKTLREAPGATIVSTDAVQFVRDLKQQKGGEICMMGGGEFARSLFEADLIDEVGVNVHPVLLGSGVPLFLPMSRQINLQLTECRQIQHGCVLLRYLVAR